MGFDAQDGGEGGAGERLHHVLVKVYPERAEIRRVLIEADIHWERVDLNGPALTVWFEAIEEASRDNRVEALVEVALREHPDHPALAILRASRGTFTVPRSPFPGFAAYDEEDAKFYAGFGAEVEEVVAGRRPFATQGLTSVRWLHVVGGSGTGKSSFVRAGVIPRVREVVAGVLVVKARPGTAPLRELASALLAQWPPSGPTPKAIDELVAALEETDGLRAFLAARRSGAHMLLLVDQMEEVWTLASRRDAQLFDARVAEALEDTALPFSLVTTIRTDLADALDVTPRLARLLNRADARTYHLRRVRADEVATLLGEIGRRAKVEWGDGLPEAIQNDLLGDLPARAADVVDGGGGGVLSLLAFVLRYLWDQRSGGRLTASAYEKSGRLRGILEGSVRRTLDSLKNVPGAALTPFRDPARKAADHARPGDVARAILMALVHFPRGGTPTRRPVLKSTLLGDGRSDPAAIHHALYRLSGGPLVIDTDAVPARLVTVTTPSDPSRTYVDLVHEALLQVEPIASWIREEATALHLRAEVEAGAAYWDDHQRASVWLPDDARTSLYAKAALVGLKPIAREYLRRAVRRATWRRWGARGASVLVLALVAAVILRAEAARRSREVERRDKEASLRREEILTEAGNLREAIEQIGLDRTRVRPALVSAVAAWFRRDGRDRTPEAADLLSQLAEARTALPRATLQLRRGKVDDARVDGARMTTVGLCPPRDACLRIYGGGTTVEHGFDLPNRAVYQDAAFSADGRAVLARTESAVQALSVDTRQPLGSPLAVEEGASLFGGSCVGVGSGNTVSSWTMEGFVHRGPVGRGVRAIALDPACDRGVFLNGANRAELWALPRAAAPMPAALPAPKVVHEGDEADLAAAILPGSKLVVTGATDHLVRVWSPTGALLNTLRGHRERVRTVVAAEDGVLFASGDTHGRVILWQAMAEGPRALWSHPGTVRRIIILPRAAGVVTAWSDDTAQVWSTAPAGARWSLDHDGPVTSFAVSRDGLSLVSNAADRLIRVWRSPTWATPTRTVRRFVAPADVAVADDGSWFALSNGAEDDANVPEWHWTDGRDPIRLRRHDAPVGRVRARARRLATASEDGEVRLWEDARELAQARFQLGAGPSPDLAWCGDDHLVVARGRRAALLGVASPPVQLPSPAGEVVSVDCAASGGYALTVSQDGHLRVWEAANGRPAGGARVDPSLLTRARLSPDGSRVAVASRDGLVRVLERTHGSLVNSLAGHGGPVLDVAWSSDGALLASGGADGRACVWEVGSGHLLASFAHGGSVSRVSFSGRGELVTACADGRVRVLPLAVEGSIRTICEGLLASFADVPAGTDEERYVEARCAERARRPPDFASVLEQLQRTGATGR